MVGRLERYYCILLVPIFDHNCTICHNAIYLSRCILVYEELFSNAQYMDLALALQTLFFLLALNHILEIYVLLISFIISQDRQLHSTVDERDA